MKPPLANGQPLAAIFASPHPQHAKQSSDQDSATDRRDTFHVQIPFMCPASTLLWPGRSFGVAPSLRHKSSRAVGASIHAPEDRRVVYRTHFLRPQAER